MTLEEAIQHCKEKADGSCACADDHRQLAEWLTELLERRKTEQQWIPWDSGGFPKDSGTYTVTAYDGANVRVTYAKYQKRLKRWELTGARAYWRVLAWMPLPEPYKEDSHDNT